jgi:hypothetical protein
MREIRTSGLTRGRTSAVIGNASHPVAFSLLYWLMDFIPRESPPREGVFPGLRPSLIAENCLPASLT